MPLWQSIGIGQQVLALYGYGICYWLPKMVLVHHCTFTLWDNSKLAKSHLATVVKIYQTTYQS